MNAEHISPTQLKRFLKHLCRVSNHYYNRELAGKTLDLHLKKVKASKSELAALQDKIDKVVHTHGRVSSLGKKHKLTSAERTELVALKHSAERLKSDNKKLRSENQKLRGSIDAIKAAHKTVKKTKRKVDSKVERFEKKVEKTKKTNFITELKDQIKLIEKEYRKLKKNKSLAPSRLHRIEVQLIKYKAKLRKLTNP